MDKIKQAISTSKDEPEDALIPVGKVGGQGSHFASAKQPGDTHAGSDTLVSSTAAPGNAQDTEGPRVGQSHLGISAPADHTSTAAGSTSTYSTTHLRQGDPTPSVVDSRSKDPLTYKKPEAQVHHEASEGSALTASSKASGIDQVRGNEQAAQEPRHGIDRIPGAYPSGEDSQEPLQETERTLGVYSGAEIAQESHQGTGWTTGSYSTTGYQNPYRTQNLDPRVDSLPLRAKDETDHSAASHSTGSTAAETGSAGLTTTGATNAISRRDDTQQSSATASSDQTSTGYPTYGSANYSQAKSANFHENPAAAISSSNDATRHSEKSPSTLSKVLGAVGFSDIAGVGSGAAVKSDDRSAVGTSGAPLTTSGTDSSKLPSQSGSKEATAATVYPSISDSAKPISLSAGGTRDADTKTQEDRHVGRDVAAGTGLVGAVGAGALGAHEYKNSSAYPEDTTRQPSSVSTSAGIATGIPAQQHEDRTHPVLGTSSHHATTIPASTTAKRHEKSISEREEDDHSKRNVTRAGTAGIGAAGVGAYGAHELNERAAAKKADEHGTESASQQKEIEKQQAARAKQAEKEEKGAAKEHEKSEKKAIAAAAAVQKERLQEAKDEKGRQGDTLATAGIGAGVTGKDAAAYGASKEDERKTSQDGEKKPGLLKRIFKRKNKDTGEEEEYEAEEETDDSHHKGAATLGAAGVGAAGAGLVSHAAGRDRETDASRLKSAEDRSIAPPSTTHSSIGYTTAEQPSTAQSSTGYASAQQPYTAQSPNAHSSTAKPHTQSSITHHPSALGAAGVGAAGAGLAGYAIGQDKEIGHTQSSSTYPSTQPATTYPSTQPSTTHPSAQSSSAYPATTQSSTAYPASAQATGQHHTTVYEDKIGGYSKPSYNPFTRDDPADTRAMDSERVVQPGQTGKTLPSEGRHGIEPAYARGAATTTTRTGGGAGTATASDPSTLGANERSSAELDKHQRNRLHKDPPAGHPAAIAANKKAFNTGLPHDSSKYPEAAARQGGHEHHHQGLRASDETEGEEHKGLREKIKEKLGLGHHDTHEER